jgi:hypothetical protein
MEYDNYSLQQLRTLDEYKSLPRSMNKSKMNRAQLVHTIRTTSVIPTTSRLRSQATKPMCKASYSIPSDAELHEALSATLKEYYEHGGRSSRKVDAIHFLINCLVRQRLQEIAPDIAAFIHVYSQPYKEVKVRGLMYDKNVDVTVKYKTNDVGLVSVKFVTSNYKQNSNNYFESMVGECVNLTTTSLPRVFWYNMFVFENTPYYDNKNEIQRYEHITIDKNLDHYKQLYMLRRIYPNLPDCISLSIIKNGGMEMHHPKKLSQMTPQKMQELIADIMRNGIATDAPFGFWYQLEQFCQKIVKVVRKHYDREERQRLPIKSV